LETRNLTEALRELNPAEFDWQFALYNTQKSRDGIALEWRLCKMKGIAPWVEIMKNTILEKTLAERVVAEYSPFLDKSVIPALNQEDDLIKSQLWDTIASIKNGLEFAPENFINGDVPKTVGYGFYGYKKDESGKISEQVLFIRRTNPFLNGGKTRICTALANEIASTDRPVLKFAPSVDFLLIDGVCYFFSPYMEKDFELESRNFAVASKRTAEIAKVEILSDYEQFEKVALSGKNSRKFLDFDKEILNHILNLSVLDREDFLITYGITIDHQGRMDTSDPDQCELVVDLLCARSCLDPLGRLSVGTNITPR
jgi:hypothetical protein